MQKNVFPLALVASVALLSSFCTNHNPIIMTNASAGTAKESGFAVVELFTSEGCSSCPSADKAVEELQKQHPHNLYVLAFHVDYWNRLGWIDSFSKADYTARQNEYARRFNLESIYTPQVVVNGKQEFVGSEKARLQSAVTAEMNVTNTATIELSAAIKDKTTVSVHYQTSGSNDEELHFALVQNEATTNVKSGENGGRSLHHINLVRDFKTVTAKEGTADLVLPPALSPATCKIIAYLQNKSGAVIAVKSIAVAGV